MLHKARPSLTATFHSPTLCSLVPGSLSLIPALTLARHPPLSVSFSSLFALLPPAPPSSCSHFPVAIFNFKAFGPSIHQHLSFGFPLHSIFTGDPFHFPPVPCLARILGPSH
ncbi:hypothetical protein BJX76DRAFT_215949 [Aspergillus varians]